MAEIPVIKTDAELLAFLRKAPATRVVRYVWDEDLAVCESADGEPSADKSVDVLAWIEEKDGSARDLLAAARGADTSDDLVGWSALPLRYGPYGSTWAMPENAYAPSAPGQTLS